jgi:hypothetical protein
LGGQGESENRTLVDPAVSFQKVSHDFQFFIGQKVAIAVYTENMVTPEAASAVTPEAASAPDFCTAEVVKAFVGKRTTSMC